MSRCHVSGLAIFVSSLCGSNIFGLFAEDLARLPSVFSPASVLPFKQRGCVSGLDRWSCRAGRFPGTWKRMKCDSDQETPLWLRHLLDISPCYDPVGHSFPSEPSPLPVLVESCHLLVFLFHLNLLKLCCVNLTISCVLIRFVGLLFGSCSTCVLYRLQHFELLDMVILSTQILFVFQTDRQ